MLYSSKAIAGKKLSLSSWCIASLYIYHFSAVSDFHPRTTVVLLDTGTPGCLTFLNDMSQYREEGRLRVLLLVFSKRLVKIFVSITGVIR